MKTNHGGDRKSSGNSYHLKSEPEKSSGNSYHLKLSAAEKLSRELGVGEKTIRNNGKYAQNLDTISDWSGEDLKIDILNGSVKLTEKEVDTLASFAEEKPYEVREAIEAVKSGEKASAVFSALRLSDEHYYKPGDRVLVNKNQLAIVVEDQLEFGAVVRTWKGTDYQTVLKCNLLPVEKEKITVCANLPVEQLAALQEKYESLEKALLELFK